MKIDKADGTTSGTKASKLKMPRVIASLYSTTPKAVIAAKSKTPVTIRMMADLRLFFVSKDIFKESDKSILTSVVKRRHSVCLTP